MKEYLDQFLERDSQSILLLKKFITDDFFKVVDLVIDHKGKIIVSGIGTSGTVARRMVHLLSCCGLPASFLHPSDGLHGASGTIHADDIVILYSKGGRSDEVNQFALIAKKRGAFIISVIENTNSALAEISDQLLPYSAIENKEQEGWICYSNSICAAVISDALCIAIMKIKNVDWEEFGVIHPGGAVGKLLSGM